MRVISRRFVPAIIASFLLVAIVSLPNLVSGLEPGEWDLVCECGPSDTRKCLEDDCPNEWSPEDSFGYCSGGEDASVSCKRVYGGKTYHKVTSCTDYVYFCEEW